MKQYDVAYTAKSCGHAYITAKSKKEAIAILERGEAESIEELECNYKFYQE